MKVVENLFVLKECSGCEACIQVCPRHVLKAECDEEGFTVPRIHNQENCIDCGLCEQVCQVHHRLIYNDSEHLPKCYVAQSLDVVNSKRSASGGAFWTIARYWIEHYNGVVVGAAFNTDFIVRHTIVDNISDLRRLQGSKYVQSIIGDVYIRVKELLQQGRYVLFSGTPCQVRGLQLFLRKEYDRLFLVDIICHGVASPSLLKDYLTKVEGYEKRNCKNIRFRWKNPWFKSGSPFIMQIKMERGKDIIRAGKNDPYLNVYLSGYAFRESCYNCQFASTYRVGDITLGDNDSHSYYNTFHPEESNSTIIVNTPRALRYWRESLSTLFDYQTIDLSIEANYNKQLKGPSPRPIQRDDIYKTWRGYSYEELFQHYGSNQSLHQYFKLRLSMLVPSKIKKALHKSNHAH